MGKFNKNWKSEFWKKGPKFSKTFPRKDIVFKRIKRPKGTVILDVVKVANKGVAVTFAKMRAPKYHKKRGRR